MDDQDLICPISQSIFLNPVIASDGHTYEKSEIEKWYNKNNTSPITREKITNTFIPNYIIKNLISKYLEKNPSMILNMYRGDLNTLITNDHFNIIEMLPEIDLSNVNDKLFIKLIQNKNTFLKIINKIVDINVTINKTPLIHYICQHCDYNIIKFFVDKGVDLECVNINEKDWTPLHTLCKFGNYKSIKLLVEKGVDLEKKSKQFKETPIFAACIYQSSLVINYLLNKGANKNIYDVSGYLPIHMIICRKNLEPSILKKLINRFGLDSLSSTGKRIIEFICEYQSYDIIEEYLNILDLDYPGNENIFCSLFDNKNISVRNLLQILFDKNINFNLNFTYKDEPFINYIISKCGNEIINILLSSKYKNCIINDIGDTPIFTACKYKRFYNIKNCIKFGIDMNYENYYKYNLLALLLVNCDYCTEYYDLINYCIENSIVSNRAINMLKGSYCIYSILDLACATDIKIVQKLYSMGYRSIIFEVKEDKLKDYYDFLNYHFKNNKKWIDLVNSPRFNGMYSMLNK